MRDIIKSIVDDYSNMYLYKDGITEHDLLELFSYKPHDTVEMLWAFMQAGLSPEKITPKIQTSILIASSTYTKNHHKEAQERYFLDLFRKHNIQMSESTLKRFVISNRCLDTDMEYPRDILHYGIMNYEETPSRIEPVFIIHNIVKYMTNKNIKFTEEEKLKVLQNYFWLTVQHPKSALKFEFKDAASKFIIQNMPFAFNTVKNGIATNVHVLRFLIKEFSDNWVRSILKTSETQQLAIQTLPETKLVKCLAQTNENQTAYIAAKPMEALRDFEAGVLIPASTTVKKHIEIVDTIINKGDIKPTMFNGLATWRELLIALIHTKFDKLTWYKVMDTILFKNKGLSDDILQEMIKQKPEVDVLIYKYYPDFFTQKKQQKELVKTTIKKHGIADFFETLFTVKQKNNISHQRGDN